ncbi:MAG: hypothetical protein L0H31_11535, partial [Nocardioidaceae bacterium]|nr:hypothetical protein [Nocardioidaceae bacterium]
GYSPLPVAPLHACLTTSYHRATFVDPDEGARLTVDVDLHFQGGRTRRNGPDRILLESKSTGSAAVDRALASNGIRPMSLSKYCVGLAMTRPELAVNRWNALLRKEFGWARASARM